MFCPEDFHFGASMYGFLSKLARDAGRETRDRIGDVHEHDRDRTGFLREGGCDGSGLAKNRDGRERNQRQVVRRAI